MNCNAMRLRYVTRAQELKLKSGCCGCSILCQRRAASDRLAAVLIGPVKSPDTLSSRSQMLEFLPPRSEYAECAQRVNSIMSAFARNDCMTWKERTWSLGLTQGNAHREQDGTKRCKGNVDCREADKEKGRYSGSQERGPC